MPLLGLIFLRHADNRFKVYLPEIEGDIPPQVSAAQCEELIRLGFQGKATIYLPELVRFDALAGLPQGAKVGQTIDDAVQLIEDDVEILGQPCIQPRRIHRHKACRAADQDILIRKIGKVLPKHLQPVRRAHSSASFIMASRACATRSSASAAGCKLRNSE